MPLPQPPRLDRTAQSIVWAIILGFVSWLLMAGVGTSLALSAIVGALLTVLIFFVVRICSGDPVTRPRSSRR